jgi:hypothetical protein
MVKLLGMKFLTRAGILLAVFFGVSLAFGTQNVFAASCDATFPASVLSNAPFTLKVELPGPSNLAVNDIAICPTDAPLGTSPDANDPDGKYCYRFSACKTGQSGAGGCNTLIDSSWFTPGSTVPGEIPSTMQVSPDGKFLLLNWSYDQSVTFKLEANDRRTSSTLTRFKACVNEWKVNISPGTAKCDDGVFGLTGPNGTNKNPLTLSFDGTKTHQFGRGSYAINIRPLNGTTDWEEVMTVGNSTGTEASLHCGTALINTGSTCSVNLADENMGNLSPGDWEIVIQDEVAEGTYCNFPFKMGDGEIVTPPSGPTTTSNPDFALCQQTQDAKTKGPDYQACNMCFCNATECNTTTAAMMSVEDKRLWTAFGCIKLSREGIVTDFLRIGLGLAGGFVLLTTLYGAFLLSTSSGDPKRVQEAQERISSAVMGLFFVVFSVIILQFIGVQLLHIPGFGGP